MVDRWFRVVPRGDSVFDVEMHIPDGRSRTVPGFCSEHEADAWIVQAKRMIREAGPWTRLTPRRPASAAASEALSEALTAPSRPPMPPNRVADGRAGAAARRPRIGPARER
jgi:hypothetical protein